MSVKKNSPSQTMESPFSRSSRLFKFNPPPRRVLELARTDRPTRIYSPPPPPSVRAQTKRGRPPCLRSIVSDGRQVVSYNPAAMDTNRIQSDLAVMMGKSGSAGTRITVELILEKLAAGETAGQILDTRPP